jgi:hypothetical protein
MDTSEDKKGEPSKTELNMTDTTIGNVENIPKAVDVEEIVNESNLGQIRNSVNENSIQLWKEPYFDKEKKVPNENKLLELACNLSTTLELDDMHILRGLMNLQQNALDKLEAREKLVSTNKIVLKIKLASTIATTKKSFKLDIDVYSSGSDLAQKISNEMQQKDDPCSDLRNSLKLISGGKTIVDNQPLNQQNIKAGASVLVIKVDSDDHSLSVVHEQKRILELARSDASILGSDDDFGAPGLQITDQTGKQIDLPKEERTALILAMSLHEKGKAAIRRSDFELALLLLIEAMEEYRKCRLELLKTVDNYALMNLDIAWCYLKLGNMTELPNAAGRLSDCESNFVQTYGANLERLNALKGHTGEESVLFVRMNLLQAIVQYHSGYIRKAKELFRKVETQLNKVLVPEDSLEEVIAAGFTKIEARLALRATECNITSAIRHAHQTREKKERIVKEEKDRMKKRRLYGKTQDGSWVNLGYVNSLVSMGMDEKLSAEALRQTNNDIDMAIEAIQESPETLIQNLTDKSALNPEITQEMVSTIMDMGFADTEAVKKALNEAKGNFRKVVSILTNNQNITSENVGSMVAKAEEAAKIAEEKLQDHKSREEAAERLGNEISEADDYLDLNLEEENEYLKMYKNILGM